MLSEDDLDLAEMSDEELAAAWDLWFDLAQATNDDDPPWTHGVFVGVILPRTAGGGETELVESRRPRRPAR
jgi:hypothetical protein